MPWVSITLEVEPAAAEALSDALLDAGAQSVALQGTTLSALLLPAQDPEALLADAARTAGVPAPAFSTHTLEDQDWVRATQAQFSPLPVGERLWIGASWHKPPADRRVVRLDPGLAFGTGSHPSTRLVLSFLEKHIHGGERVLDYGCGSGILAIAAARLGASQVDAVDLDPQAVETTAANARANDVAVRAALPHSLETAQYDVVVANILSQTLIVLEPVLAARTATGGRIALSGILRTQADEVCSAYGGSFQAAVALEEEGWALIVGQRR
jgi:ribosomal protein L11 methyltransferase